MKLPLIPVLTLTFLLSGFCPVAAAEFYVAQTGDDNDAGTQAEPFATVAHALSEAGNGDTVLLERGSVFRESGLNAPNGVTITDYGDPADPLPALVGSVEVTGWSPATGKPGVYTAPLPGLSGPVRGLYVDNARAVLARYPNEAWLYTDNDNRDVIEDAEQAEHPEAAPNRWTGANVRWRKWSWWYETRVIDADDGAGTLTLSPVNDAGNTDPDSGYYIDNSLAELDAENEWFWDSTTETLYYYPPHGQDPAALGIEAVIAKQALSLGNGCTLENVAFRYYKGRGLSIGNTATMQGCVVENIAEERRTYVDNQGVEHLSFDAIGLQGGWNAGGSLIQDNIFRDILGVAITWNENPNGGTGTVIEGNRIERAGTVPGLGGNGVWKVGGIYITNGNGTVVRRNRINGAGYGGIVFNSNGLTAEQNVIINAMATLNDGAAIYCNAGENLIRENIILSTQGDLVSTQPWTPLSHGIWVEFLEEFRDSQIIGNTVYNSGCHGIFLVNNFDCTIRGNTLFSNRNRALHLGGSTLDPQDDQPDQGHVIEDNLLVIGAVGWQGPVGYENFRQWPEVHLAALSYANGDSPDMDYGTMTGATFVHPPGTELIWRDWSNRTVAEWQSEEPDWADPSPTVITGNAFLFINDTDTSVDFPLPGGITWQELDGGAVSGTISISPYRSTILLATAGDISGMSDAFLASEIGEPDAGDPDPRISHYFSLLMNDTDEDLEFPLDPAVNWRLPDGTAPGPFVKVRARHSRVLLNQPGEPYYYWGRTLPKTFAEWIAPFGLPPDQQQSDDDPSRNNLTNAGHYLFGIDADANALPTLDIRHGADPDSWVLRFPRYKFAEEAAFSIEIRENPHLQTTIGWTTLTGLTESVTPDPLDAYVEWVEITFASPATHIWARIRPTVVPDEES